MLTDRELQALSNLGNEEEAAAEEIATLRASNADLLSQIAVLADLLDEAGRAILSFEPDITDDDDLLPELLDKIEDAVRAVRMQRRPDTCAP